MFVINGSGSRSVNKPRQLLDTVDISKKLKSNSTSNDTLKHPKAACQTAVPYGWERGNDGLVESPTERGVISQILTFRALGIGYRQIAKHLNAVNAPSKRGGRWWPKVIRQIYLREQQKGAGMKTNKKA